MTLSVGDVYISDKGIGRFTAVVVAIYGREVVFQLIRTRSGEIRTNGGKFVIPVSFLSSRACGWAALGSSPADTEQK